MTVSEERLAERCAAALEQIAKALSKMAESLDERDLYLKMIELDEDVRKSFIAASGGPKELAIRIAKSLTITNGGSAG